MKKQTLVASVMAILTAGTSTSLMAHNPPTSAGMEKCYSTTFAAKNQCVTKTHTCSLSKKAKYPSSWVFVSKGTCENKGGSTQAQEA